MLQVDQLICFFISPGRFQSPDARCLSRLMLSLQETKGPMQHILPASVCKMVGDVQEVSLEDIVRVWWKYNNHTPFFKYSGTARMVRALIKQDSGQASVQCGMSDDDT
jgi:hypothetical protein